MTRILGISAYFHDSAAAMLVDGEIVAAAQEERFSRKKHDARFPKNAIKYCLKEVNCNIRSIDYIVYYEKPLLTFERLLKTYISNSPKGFGSFLHAMPIWLTEKLFLKRIIKNELAKLGNFNTKEIPELLFNEHHRSHASSAFFPSPFDEAAVICLDGVGEWATTSVWKGEENKLIPLWEMHFPHSLGLLYSAFTYFTGFKVNSGEYKLMGLSPYGEPKYIQKILDNLIDLKEDGTFRMNMEYFTYETDLKMTGARFSELFGGPPRTPESEIKQREMDLAASIQHVAEEIILRLGQTVHKETGMKNLCMAGGVALNCVANGRLLREGPFEELWIQPAAGDAGGSIGAAKTVWYEYLRNKRTPMQDDAMHGAYLGSEFSQKEIQHFLDKGNYPFRCLKGDELTNEVASIIAKQDIVGWFDGRMEFGPRALGSRSILGDPRSPKTQSVMNLKIKNRESFRPFAPVVKKEKVSEWFELDRDSPYMLLVAEVKKERQIAMTKKQKADFGIKNINTPRSDLPAITHVDYSARVQTVNQGNNPRFWKLLDAFEKITGCPVLVNTSFNVRGEPLVCTPEDAYRCFMRTEMDYLVIGDNLLSKTMQPEVPKDESWKKEFELD